LRDLAAFVLGSSGDPVAAVAVAETASPNDLRAIIVACWTSKPWMVDFNILRLRLSQFSTLLRSLIRFSNSSVSSPGNAEPNPPAAFEASAAVNGN